MTEKRTRRRRQRYRLALVCLAVLVAGATGYALIHPAITMTGTAHTHDASCYTQIVSKTEQALSCTFAQAHAEDTARILHLHDQNCYDAAGMLVCRMAQQASSMVTQSVDAFVRRDVDLARSIAKQDDLVDEDFSNVKQALIAAIAREPGQGEVALDLLMIAKYFERIGDHAVNLSEWVEFSVTGVHKHDGVEYE